MTSEGMGMFRRRPAAGMKDMVAARGRFAPPPRVTSSSRRRMSIPGGSTAGSHRARHLFATTTIVTTLEAGATAVHFAEDQHEARRIGRDACRQLSHRRPGSPRGDSRVRHPAAARIEPDAGLCRQASDLFDDQRHRGAPAVEGCRGDLRDVAAQRVRDAGAHRSAACRVAAGHRLRGLGRRAQSRGFPCGGLSGRSPDTTARSGA